MPIYKYGVLKCTQNLINEETILLIGWLWNKLIKIDLLLEIVLNFNSNADN